MTGFYGFYFFFHVLASSLSPTTTPFFLCLSAAFFRDAMARLNGKNILVRVPLLYVLYLGAGRRQQARWPADLSGVGCSTSCIDSTPKYF